MAFVLTLFYRNTFGIIKYKYIILLPIVYVVFEIKNPQRTLKVLFGLKNKNIKHMKKKCSYKKRVIESNYRTTRNIKWLKKHNLIIKTDLKWQWKCKWKIWNNDKKW